MVLQEEWHQHHGITVIPFFPYPFFNNYIHNWAKVPQHLTLRDSRIFLLTCASKNKQDLRKCCGSKGVEKPAPFLLVVMREKRGADTHRWKRNCISPCWLKGDSGRPLEWGRKYQDTEEREEFTRASLIQGDISRAKLFGRQWQPLLQKRWKVETLPIEEMESKVVSDYLPTQVVWIVAGKIHFPLLAP